MWLFKKLEWLNLYDFALWPIIHNFKLLQTLKLGMKSFPGNMTMNFDYRKCLCDVDVLW